MGPGFVEIISLLLGLSGFGVQANPKANTPDVSLQYAMSDADVIVHIDALSLVPNNYKVLQALPANANIKASPELVTAVRKAIGEVEGARGLAKKMTGIDAVTDIYDADVFVQVSDKAKPTFVAVVHGKFSAANIDAIAKNTNAQVQKIGGGSMVQTGNDDPAVAVTKDGVMLAGTIDLVKARLADTWKAPARPANSSLAYAAEVLAQKPVFSITTSLSPAAKRHVLQEMGAGKKNFGTDLVQRGKMSSLSVYADGIGWSWIDSTKAGLDNMELMSQGFLDLMKAGHIAPRAIAKIALGAIDSYKGVDKQVDAVIARKVEVMKVLNTYSGDGNFLQSVVKDPKTLRLTVRATGKSLSEVVPAGVMFPIGMAFVLFRAGDATVAPAPMPTQIATPPGKGGGLAPKKK